MPGAGHSGYSAKRTFKAVLGAPSPRPRPLHGTPTASHPWPPHCGHAERGERKGRDGREEGRERGERGMNAKSARSACRQDRNPCLGTVLRVLYLSSVPRVTESQLSRQHHGHHSLVVSLHTLAARVWAEAYMAACNTIDGCCHRHPMHPFAHLETNLVLRRLRQSTICS